MCTKRTIKRRGNKEQKGEIDWGKKFEEQYTMLRQLSEKVKKIKQRNECKTNTRNINFQMNKNEEKQVLREMCEKEEKKNEDEQILKSLHKE